MLKKTMKDNKRYILLRSRLLACLLTIIILFGSVSSVSAENNTSVNYMDYVSNVTVDGENDIVTIDLPVSWCQMIAMDSNNTPIQTFNSNWAVLDNINATRFLIAPFGDADVFFDSSSYDGRYLSTSNIPDDAEFSVSVDFYAYRQNLVLELESAVCMFVKSDHIQMAQFDEHNFGPDTVGDKLTLYFTGSSTFPYGYDGFFPLFNLGIGGTYKYVEVNMKSFSMTLSINSYYRALQESGIKEGIDDLQKQLDEQDRKLDDFLDQQQQTNDKLDALPGQIGDEMQDVIDKEEEKAESEGNKFVDQILDALPDPSADVLAALKSLTDATAYTGTDAVLYIPAIVLPGVDGLFPETEIWGGTAFDFGESVAMLPPTLLTLVQALFTIAIVLYCVYEFKGIISYCLTLRESKGG